MKVTPLTADQMRFVIRCVKTYMEVFEREKKQLPFPVDVEHSELLVWLLHGREPLLKPPPKFYSRPCHSLDMGAAISVIDGPFSIAPTKCPDGDTVIGQEFFEHLGDERYKFIPTGYTYKSFVRDGRFFLQREMPDTTAENQA